ncbi:MAG: IS21 family transposase, partial [Alphaproteobacteria bacterium]|nr:IS21 family transposase [Alphaproteobacteria bacterium]
ADQLDRAALGRLVHSIRRVLVDDGILKRKPHPEQGFRACLGILRLRKSYGPDRLEAACGRAFEINGLSYSSVASILKNNIDRRRRDPATADGPVIHHQHLRRPTYFQ